MTLDTQELAHPETLKAPVTFFNFFESEIELGLGEFTYVDKRKYKFTKNTHLSSNFLQCSLSQ